MEGGILMAASGPWEVKSTTAGGDATQDHFSIIAKFDCTKFFISAQPASPGIRLTNGQPGGRLPENLVQKSKGIDILIFNM